MEDFLNGKDYVLQIDTDTPITAASGTDGSYRTIACEISHDETISNATTQTSNKCTLGWRVSNSGDKAWDLSGEYHAIDPSTGTGSPASYSEMRALAASGAKFWARRALLDPGSGKFLPDIEGVVLASNFNGSFNTTEAVQFTIELEGQGEPILAQTT